MHAPTPAERVTRARAALRAAEERTGARSLEVVPAAEVAVTLGSVDAARLSAHEASSAPVHAVDTLISTERPPLPVPPELAPLLPAGLRRGSTIQVDGSTSVLLALLSEASRAGSWVAVVGAPSIGLLAVAQAGIDLSRLVLVPAPGAQAAPVLAALLDGMDLVVVGPEVVLLGADRRLLGARARERASIIVSLRPWEGAHTTLATERSRWAGLGTGRGRLSSREMTVTRTDRARGTTYRHTVTMPFARPVTRVPGPDAPGAPVVVPSPVETSVAVHVVVPAAAVAASALPAAAVHAAQRSAVRQPFAQVG